MRRKAGLVGLVMCFLLTAHGLLSAQELQTPSTTLEDVVTVVQGNPNVSEKQIQVLTAFLTTAIEQGAITPEQALQLLGTVGWTELADGAGFAVRALELALIALTTEGASFDEILAELTDIAESGELGPLASEMGPGNSLPALATALLRGKGAGEFAPELLAAIEDAVSSGVPPGQVIHTVRSLRGASGEELLAAVEHLKDQISAGVPPGQALGHGQNEEQNEEQAALGSNSHGNAGDNMHGPPPGRGKPEDEELEQKEISEGTPPGKALGQGHMQNEEQNEEQAVLGSADHGKPTDEEKIRHGPPPGRGKPEDEDEGHGRGKGKGKSG